MGISFFETVISPQAIQLTTDVLRSGWVSEGFRVADFEEALSREHHLSHPVALNSGTSALHLAPVLVERRASFVRALEHRGVPTSVVHRRIARHPVFGSARQELAGQDAFDERQISVPLHSSLSEREVQQIVEAVRAGW